MGNSVTYFFLCLLVCAGCESRRDLVNDPANSPIVVPFDLRYDEEQNAVIIEWEYLGIEPAARYQIWRVERDGIHMLPWYNLPTPSREVNRRADVWDMMPIVDSAIHAGEKYIYILRTETAGKRLAEAPVGEVQIPGARLEKIQFLPEDGTATVDWYLPTGVLRRYELLRSVDDAAAQMIFQSEDPAVASFTDALIEGNRKYTYRLRNTMDRGVVLESRDIALHPYQRRLDFNIVEASNAFVALTSATALGSPALALLATSDAISIREVNRGLKTTFVLARDRIMVFNADGQPVLRWGGLDDLDLDSAGLAVSEFEDVYVWDAQNRIVLFKSVPPFLVRFAEENAN